MFRILALALLLTTIALTATPASGAERLALVDLPKRAAAEAERLAGVELTGHGHEGQVGAIATTAGLRALRDAGIPTRVETADLAVQDRADRASDAAFARQTPVSRLPSGRTGYRRLADYEQDLAELVTDHPAIVRPITLGLKTLQGREIRGVEITHDVAEQADGKPVVLQLGLHHAREWPSSEHVMELATDLARSDGKDAQVTKLLGQVRVILIPIVNVDGFVFSRESAFNPEQPGVSDLTSLTQSGAYRRKNCRAAGSVGPMPAPPACADDAAGVDLNRNYGIHWGGDGSSTFPQMQDFRGDSPFSEPESSAIRRLVTSRQIALTITNHTAGKLVLRPPGVKSVENVPDEPGLKALGDAFARDNGYRSEHSWELYDNSGTTEDFSYGVTGGYGYTFEINDQGFHPAYEGAVVDEYLGSGATAGRGNREAYLRGLEFAADVASHALIEGTAPPGRTLRVRRTVRSVTSPVCVFQFTGFFSTACGPTTAPIAFTDELDSVYRVPASGRIAWHVNPSKAPLSQDDGLWQLTCEDASGKVIQRTTVAVDRGERARLDLGCGTAAGAAPRCVPAPGPLRGVAAIPVRGARAIRITGRAEDPGAGVRLDLFRVTSGRRVTDGRLVARRPSVPARGGLAFTGKTLGAGIYVARLRAGATARRVAFVVGATGRIRVLAAFDRGELCGLLRSARLTLPAVGGSTRRPARLRIDVLDGTRVAVDVFRGTRRIARLPARRLSGKRDLTLPRSVTTTRGAMTVSVTAVRGGTRSRTTLNLLGI